MQTSRIITEVNTEIIPGIIIGLLLVCTAIFFCLLFAKLHIRKIKNYTALIHQKDLDFQKTLNTTMIETQEQLLQNISQDLHDDAGQQLTYINFQLENLKLDSPELQQLLEPVSQSVGKLSGSIRNISHSLSNQLLLRQDLLKAIESEITRLKNIGNLKLSHSIAHPGMAFTSDEKIVIYRIFQECLNNSCKHAQASEINISITFNPDFKMTVTDNGRGFNPEKTGHTLGLQNMASRAQMIHYGLEIISAPGKGTRIILMANPKTDYGKNSHRHHR